MPASFSHRLTAPLAGACPEPDAKLPGGGFIGLVGAFDHATTVPYTGTRPDDNHVYLWVRVPSGAVAGRYEAAVNVRSTTGSPDLQYATREMTLAVEAWPEPGAVPHAAVSFAGLGLTEADFATVQEGELRSLVMTYAASCARMAVYGVEYTEHTGLHDVHRNPGLHDGDGALAFFFDAAHGGPAVRWVFLKFQGDAVG